MLEQSAEYRRGRRRYVTLLITDYRSLAMARSCKRYDVQCSRRAVMPPNPNIPMTVPPPTSGYPDNAVGWWCGAHFSNRRRRRIWTACDLNHSGGRRRTLRDDFAFDTANQGKHGARDSRQRKWDRKKNFHGCSIQPFEETQVARRAAKRSSTPK